MGKQDILDKIKIAVIDSGIDKALKSGITEIHNHTREDEFDLNGHGASAFNLKENSQGKQVMGSSHIK